MCEGQGVLPIDHESDFDQSAYSKEIRLSILLSYSTTTYIHFLSQSRMKKMQKQNTVIHVAYRWICLK